MKDTYNDSDAIEIAPGVYHLGVQDIPNSFNNIPYLIVDGGEAVVIDPGSAKPEFFNVVMKKIRGVIDMKKIKHIIVQHQDPDLCAAIPLIEKEVHPDVKVYAPLEAKVLVQHYGFTSPMVPLDDDDELTFGNDRTLQFIMTPYCHFVGSMVTYDFKTKSLFSSDAFGGFTGKSSLYVEVEYPAQLSAFLGQYLGSKKALEYALKRIEKLDDHYGIELICPQHGCLIPKGIIAAYIKAAHELHVGGEVDALAAKHGIKLKHSQ
ncbi:MAG: FprA family A-type flavoprotein [Nitrospinota bacterium]|nr:FprA family A-type flavoprotein [Nitrospinota bacterium]